MSSMAGWWFCGGRFEAASALVLLAISSPTVPTAAAGRPEAPSWVFASLGHPNFRTDSRGHHVPSLLWLAAAVGVWSHDKRLCRTVSWLVMSHKDWSECSLAGGWTCMAFWKPSLVVWQACGDTTGNRGMLSYTSYSSGFLCWALEHLQWKKTADSNDYSDYSSYNHDEAEGREGRAEAEGSSSSASCSSDSASWARAVSFVKIHIVTGRCHQIRLHTAHVGHPVITDARYASAATFQEDRLWCPRNFLHRYCLEFSAEASWTSQTKVPQALFRYVSTVLQDGSLHTFNTQILVLPLDQFALWQGGRAATFRPETGVGKTTSG